MAGGLGPPAARAMMIYACSFVCKRRGHGQLSWTQHADGEGDESYLVNAEDGGGSIGSELEGRGLAGQKIQNVGLSGIDGSAGLMAERERENDVSNCTLTAVRAAKGKRCTSTLTPSFVLPPV